MKSLLISLLALALMTACTGDSSFPEPTGKGTIRAVNAIKGSPNMNFLIEERSSGTPGYKQASTPQQFDDFEYNFNFDVFLAGDSTPTRVATRRLKVERDQEYTFVITGSLASPDILVWETPEREFEEGGGVFEVRFAHLVEGFDAVDVYFAEEGVVPAAGQEIASLAYGEVMPAMDLTAGDYVLTITPAGDPDTVLLQSIAINYAAANAILFGLFAPNENDLDPISVQGFFSRGAQAFVADADSSARLRLIHSAFDLGNVDVYNDDELTELLAGDVMHTDVTGDLPVAVGSNEINVTPAGSTASLLVEGSVNLGQSTFNNAIVFGSEGSYQLAAYIPDRASTQTIVKASVFNGASNHPLVDLYSVNRGEVVEDTSLPRAANIPTGQRSTTVQLRGAGSFDIYLTESGDRSAVIAGPLPVDVELGDVLELMLFDTADPNVGELVQLPTP